MFKFQIGHKVYDAYNIRGTITAVDNKYERALVEYNDVKAKWRDFNTLTFKPKGEQDEYSL